MARPHSEQIKDLSIEDIGALKIWEMLALAIPRGAAEGVAEIINASPRTVRSWRNDPEADDRIPDPHGRRGPIHEFMQFLFAVNMRCPEGAELIVKWIERQLAEAQAIQGRDELLAALKVADESRALAEKIIAITGGLPRSKT